MSDEPERWDLRSPTIDEVVIGYLGGNHVRPHCEDGKTRLGRIPCRTKYRAWIEKDDVVLTEPWDGQDEKAAIEWCYTGQDARADGHLE